MKRRSFLSGLALSATGLPVLAGSNATGILGTPNSLSGPDAERLELHNDRLKLSLSRINVPVETWSQLKQSTKVWDEVFFSKSARVEFQENPARFLRSRGIPPELLSNNDIEVRLLRAVSNENILNMAVDGDYAGFVQELAANGVLQGSESGIKAKIMEIFANNRSKIEENLAELGINSEDEIKQYLNTDEMQAIMQYVSEGRLVFPGLVVLAALAAIYTFAVIYISIGINFGFAVFAGAVFSVYSLVYASIAAEGSGADNMAARQRISMMAPELYEDMEVKLRLAKLVGNKSIAEKSYRDLVRIEISAFLGAAEDIGMFQIDDEIRSDFYMQLENLVSNATGLGKQEIHQS